MSLENRCSPETGELACSSSLQVGSGGGGANCKPSPLWILEKALAQASSSRRLFVQQRQLLAVLSHLSNWNRCLLSSCGDLHVGVISF